MGMPQEYPSLGTEHHRTNSSIGWREKSDLIVKQVWYVVQADDVGRFSSSLKVQTSDEESIVAKGPEYAPDSACLIILQVLAGVELACV